MKKLTLVPVLYICGTKAAYEREGELSEDVLSVASAYNESWCGRTAAD